MTHTRRFFRSRAKSTSPLFRESSNLSPPNVHIYVCAKIASDDRSRSNRVCANDCFRSDRKSPSTRRASSGRVRAGLKPAAHSSRPADGPLIERDPFYLGRNLERAASIARRSSPLNVRRILPCLASAFNYRARLSSTLPHNKIMCERLFILFLKNLL